MHTRPRGTADIFWDQHTVIFQRIDHYAVSKQSLPNKEASQSLCIERLKQGWLPLHAAASRVDLCLGSNKCLSVARRICHPWVEGSFPRASVIRQLPIFKARLAGSAELFG